MSLLAITGATGFVGGRLLRAARDTGHNIRALTRRPQPPAEGIEWVDGALEDAPALARLVSGADAVIHVAGVVGAPDRAGFARGNIDGTQAMLAAARTAGISRFVHVSSLAAREPGLSDYGWSKAGAEEAVTDSPLAWTILRPPAVYGPGDMEMRDLFRMAKAGVMLLPPPGRLSLIHVDDLATLLVALAESDVGISAIFEADDGVPGGWTHRDAARAVATAVGKRVRTMTLPRPLLDLAARGDRLVRRTGAKLTPDRVRYICHPDWVSKTDRKPPESLWKPRIDTATGLRETADWYRARRLL